MRKKNFILSIVIVLLSSCMISDPYTEKTPDQGSVGTLAAEAEAIPESFAWETMKYEELEILNTNTTVYNKAGKLIADKLPLGTYTIPMNATDSIVAVQITNYSVCSSSNSIYFPAKEAFGSFMAEDIFPYKGDMDFNDVVFGFNIRYDFVPGTSDKVSRMVVRIRPEAVGGNSDLIGIGLKFNSKSIVVEKVSGSNTISESNFASLDRNGTENGQQSCTVVPLIGDFRASFSSRNGFLNTFASLAPISAEDTEVTIEFKEGYYPDYASVLAFLCSSEPDMGFSFFVTVDSRGKEIFAKGNVPTDKFDKSYFKTIGKNDFSNADNFVWAIQSSTHIAYPLEMVSIEDAYPLFSNWIYSSGNKDYNWYESPVEGKIFNFAV